MDPAGKLPGRGAYVHREAQCVEAALKRKAFERALRASLDAGEAARLKTGIERELTG